MNGANVKVYSVSKNGESFISKNFKVREFKCKDGSDTVFISNELVEVLQDVRDSFKRTVIINSGFRTESHNRKVGGSEYSQHKYGLAADIAVTGVSPSEVAHYLERKYPDKYGIGRYMSFTHIDVRKEKSRWKG